jgi:hypothetical protein
MNKVITWGYCLCLLASQAFSQTADSVIRIETTFWGIQYRQGTQQLSFKEVGVALAADPEAFEEYRKARTNYVGGTVVGLTGAALIGYSVGSALSGSAPHWSVAVTGAGVLLAAIPLNNGFHRRIHRAIGMYNNKTASGQACSWQIQPYGAGARIVLRF